MSLFFRQNRLLLLNLFCLVFGITDFSYSNVQHPYYQNAYMARIYDSKDVDLQIKNTACHASYAQITMDNKIPQANSYVKSFQYQTFQEAPFYHPYLSPSYQTFLQITLGFGSQPKASVKIPIGEKIPNYARSIGIVLGGDGNSPDILYFIIKEAGKTRQLAVEGFKKNTYTLYILPLGLSKKTRTLEKLVIRHRFKANLSKLTDTSLAIGNIFFYDFAVSRPIEVQTQEPIYTPLSFINKGQEHLLFPFGQWNKDDTLYLNIKNLKPSTLEIYLNLRDRIKKAFLIRVFVAPIDSTQNKFQCIQIKLPKEVIHYQQKQTRGIYFSLRGLKFIPISPKYSASTTDINVVEKAFLQRKDWVTYSYPLDKN